MHYGVRIFIIFWWDDMINSSLHNAPYVRQWIGSALIQIMACCLFGAKPLSKPMLYIANWALRNKFKWSFNQIHHLFIHKSAPENSVCEMTAILVRSRWFKQFSNGLASHCYFFINQGLCSCFSVFWLIPCYEPTGTLWNYTASYMWNLISICLACGILNPNMSPEAVMELFSCRHWWIYCNKTYILVSFWSNGFEINVGEILKKFCFPVVLAIVQ